MGILEGSGGGGSIDVINADGEGEEDQYAESNELECTDPFKLSYAQHVDQVGREVRDVKGGFDFRGWCFGVLG